MQHPRKLACWRVDAPVDTPHHARLVERSTISGDAGPNAGQFSMMSTFVQVLEHIEQNAGQFSMMSTFVLKHIEQHVESTKHAFQYKTCTLAPSLYKTRPRSGSVWWAV